METTTNKDIVLQFYKQVIGERREELIDELISDTYIQHNPLVKGGKEALREMVRYLKQLPKPAMTQSPVITVFEDGDFVVLHLRIAFMNKHQEVIDIFRLENGKLAEHWDAIQDLPVDQPLDLSQKQPGESGHTDRYKQLAAQLFAGNPANEQLQAVLASRQHLKIHRILGQGNAVLVQSEGQLAQKPFVFYDLLHFSEGHLAEICSVVQEIPAQMAHANGMI